MIERITPVLEVLNRLGVKPEVGKNEIKIRGELKYAEHNRSGYNIGIKMEDLEIAFMNSYGTSTLTIWKLEGGRPKLLKKILFNGILYGYYDSGYLNISISEIRKIIEFLEIGEKVEEMINEIRLAGFEIDHDPGRRIIKIKGSVERFVTFGLPRPYLKLRKGESVLIYENVEGEHYIKISKNDKEYGYKIGEAEEASATYEYPYLIIKYSEVS